ncbi:homospermidine synthase [Paraburkholderia rhynchosiae]|uniref:Homospermidine synthase n=1 Tax=Paraburkholderia rhynchosiae TaxID=487049 RepID=A0A6J5BBM8_9BURK|nr:saccharopine dehydrogenase C-terminal domain-containing protein [Paraburkholderia rhynchosiae]CAB3698574.1 Homospermidine synthase [Paraburkholderia rhynchosiae]
MQKSQAREQKHAALSGKLVIIGFGSIAKAVLPLLLRHIDVSTDRIVVICTHADDTTLARECGVELCVDPLTRDNYVSILQRFVSQDDFVLNLSVSVSSEALVRFCWERGALYLDTSIEPWGDSVTDENAPLSQRSNYALREAVLSFRLDKRNGPTAIMTQGANPGLASMLVKEALVNMAADEGIDPGRLACFEDWAALAMRLQICAIHIAEQDTQIAERRKARDEFVNTWSVDAFIEEGLQPAELGWGSHEKHWPADAMRHGFGSDAAIYLRRPGFATRVRSWTPLGGPFHGFLITHGESISIADHLTLRENGVVKYRPTVHYAYRPCDDALLSIDELAGLGWIAQANSHILREDVTQGMDELGVLLMGNPRGVYWFGSRLTTDGARRLAPQNTATSLQVVAGVLGGIVWALSNPRAGIVEPDDLDHEAVMRVARPYLGEVVGVYGDWTPLSHRLALYEEPKDESDPWQFVNFRVS